MIKCDICRISIPDVKAIGYIRIPHSDNDTKVCECKKCYNKRRTRTSKILKSWQLAA